MSLGKLLPLSTGAKLPQIGLGTYSLKSIEGEDAVRTSFRVHTYCDLIQHSD